MSTPGFWQYALTVLLSYLLGSFNFAIIISRWLKHDDVRNYGSGNAGITNYARTFGGKSTILVALGDMGKCFLAVLVSRWLVGDLAKFIAGLSVMLGHAYPLYFGFRGGKGVLTTGALILAFDLRMAAIGFSIFLIIAFATKYISLASLVAVWSILPMVWYYYRDAPHAWWCILIYGIIAALITFFHRTNILRLIRGTESKFQFKRKKKAPDAGPSDDGTNNK